MSSLAGKQVAFTGRLSTMTRAEAIRYLEKAGAVFAKFPNKTTSFLVVGQADGPLGKNGKPSTKLRKTRELQKEKFEVQILTETEFLQSVGLEHLVEYLDQLYTVTQLKRILGVTTAELRSWVRQKLIHPAKVSRKLEWFDFKEVMIARTLHELTNSGTKLSTIKKSLEEMSNWLPDARKMLNQVEAYEPAGRLRIRLPDGEAASSDGQMLLGFSESRKANIKEFRLNHEDTADDWFEAGVLAEDSRNLDQAAEAYERALQIGGPQAETCFNLGNVLRVMNRKSEAVQRYLQVVEIDPEYVEAWNNLGIVLSDLNRLEKAIDAYKAALKYEPHYADAHWNLAETFEQLGRISHACQHWTAYLEEDPHSSASENVRLHLRDLETRDQDERQSGIKVT